MRKLVNIFMVLLFLMIALLTGWLLSALLRHPTRSIEIGMPTAFHPQITPTIYPSTMTVLEGIQSLSRLETASYHMEKVITAESGQGPLGFLFGDKLLLIAHGEVIAGVDLSDFGPNDVRTTDDGTVYIHPPAAEVFVNTLDNNRTYVYDRRTGAAGMNPQLETAARQEAEQMILQSAIEDGILDEAEKNAREVLRSFVLSLGFQHVIFVTEMPTPTPAPTVAVSPILTPAP